MCLAWIASQCRAAPICLKEPAFLWQLEPSDPRRKQQSSALSHSALCLDSFEQGDTYADAALSARRVRLLPVLTSYLQTGLSLRGVKDSKVGKRGNAAGQRPPLTLPVLSACPAVFPAFLRLPACPLAHTATAARPFSPPRPASNETVGPHARKGRKGDPGGVNGAPGLQHEARAGACLSLRGRARSLPSPWSLLTKHATVRYRIRPLNLNSHRPAAGARKQERHPPVGIRRRAREALRKVASPALLVRARASASGPCWRVLRQMSCLLQP